MPIANDSTFLEGSPLRATKSSPRYSYLFLVQDFDMATMIPPSSSTLDLRSTTGAIFLGVIGAAMLYGVTNVQVYFYVRNYRQDKIVLKCLVAFLWYIAAILGSGNFVDVIMINFRHWRWYTFSFSLYCI
ncbi:hypothetical protein F5887DRAFT_683710 [Amanita rubescens]|nr:hypothetical protein F5887DRAFT_683710 [Amanita rubescens]